MIIALILSHNTDHYPYHNLLAPQKWLIQRTKPDSKSTQLNNQSLTSPEPRHWLSKLTMYEEEQQYSNEKIHQTDNSNREVGAIH